jgi:hypothetical protein
MAGLKREARLRADVPAIHVSLQMDAVKTWMPGTSPGMTNCGVSRLMVREA